MRRILVATLMAGSVLQAFTAALWMNPLTTRLILTTEFGQSPKLVNVWTVWEPQPRLMEQPAWAMIAGIEECHGFAGALRASGGRGYGGPLEVPHLLV